MSPCTYYGPGEHEEILSEEVQFFTRVSCALLTGANRLGMMWELLDIIDYEEAGFTRALLEEWWKDHQEKDRIRRAVESTQEERRKRAQEALEKLTPEDRKVLGL